MPPYHHRPFTPPTEIRPIRDERPPSPGATYPHQQYHHGPSQGGSGGGIASGAPAPASAITAEAAAREHENRPGSAMKRPREWDSHDSGPTKKPANEETRGRLEDQLPRRPSPPRDSHHRSSSEARREEQRRANENYHPSEAAHHPSTLPSIQHMQPTPNSATSANPPSGEGPTNGASANGGSAAVKEERKDPNLAHEPAARKMDVDENYDDDGEDEKRVGATKGSPRGATNGNTHPNGDRNANDANYSSQPKQESATV